MSNDASKEFYDREAAQAMADRTDQQEVAEANLRALRAEIAERWGMQTKISHWLNDALQANGATHLMLGGASARGIEGITHTAGKNTNIIVIENNITAIHDLVNDFGVLDGNKKTHAIFIHLFAQLQRERESISRVFQYQAPIIERMRARRQNHKQKRPHVFIIADTPTGEAAGAMLDDALVDSASYNGSTIGAQHLVLDNEAGDALSHLAIQAENAKGRQKTAMTANMHQAIGAWFLRRAADVAHAYLKNGAPFIVHGSAHVPSHIDNLAALDYLSTTTLHGIRELWTLQRQVAIRLLDDSLNKDPHGQNMLYALELLRREPDLRQLDEAENESCEGK